MCQSIVPSERDDLTLSPTSTEPAGVVNIALPFWTTLNAWVQASRFAGSAMYSNALSYGDSIRTDSTLKVSIAPPCCYGHLDPNSTKGVTSKSQGSEARC